MIVFILSFLSIYLSREMISPVFMLYNNMVKYYYVVNILKTTDRLLSMHNYDDSYLKK